MSKDDDVATTLQSLFEGDAHFPILMRHATRIAFRLGEGVALLEMDAAQDRVDLRENDDRDARPR